MQKTIIENEPSSPVLLFDIDGTILSGTLSPRVFPDVRHFLERAFKQELTVGVYSNNCRLCLWYKFLWVDYLSVSQFAQEWLFLGWNKARYLPAIGEKAQGHRLIFFENSVKEVQKIVSVLPKAWIFLLDRNEVLAEDFGRNVRIVKSLDTISVGDLVVY